MNTPKQIAEFFADLGVTKTETPTGRLCLLAVLAGMFIALAGVASTVANTVAGRLAGACVFPAGLAMVVVAGSELFTGDNLMIVSLLEGRIRLGAMVRVLALVYLGNLVGSVLVAILASLGGVLDGPAEAVVSAAVNKTGMSFGAALLRGVLCNFLVCIAVWMAAAAKEPVGKILGVFFPIMAFVLSGYEHCVANMYYLPAGILTAARCGLEAPGLTWGTALLRNLLPVTLGNMIGGMGVGVCYRLAYLKK